MGKTPRCFRRDLNCPSYHPRTRQRASDSQPERESTLRPFGLTLALVVTRLLLAARSQTRGFESLACHRQTRPFRPTPRVLPRLAATSVLAVMSLADVTPRPTTVCASRPTRHSHRTVHKDMNTVRFPKVEGASPLVSLGGRCSLFGPISAKTHRQALPGRSHG
jgi:hypothetical protein